MIPELLHLEVKSNFGWTRFFAPPFINFLKKVEPEMAKYRRFWPFWASYNIGVFSPIQEYRSFFSYIGDIGGTTHPGLHMKTKVVQNIQTFRHSWFPAFVWHSDIFLLDSLNRSYRSLTTVNNYRDSRYSTGERRRRRMGADTDTVAGPPLNKLTANGSQPCLSSSRLNAEPSSEPERASARQAGYGGSHTNEYISL